jgi:hypothetical protein
MWKKKPVISNTGKFFCFNNNVSNLYNNSVVDKIYGMAYVFTFLLFRKPNKTTINKNKTTIFIGQRPFGSRLYLDISRSSSNVLDEDYSSNVPDEDYSSNVPDEDYSSNESCSTTFDIYIFIPVNDRNSLEAQKVKHPHR